jgi:hypothetical protein
MSQVDSPLSPISSSSTNEISSNTSIDLDPRPEKKKDQANVDELSNEIEKILGENNDSDQNKDLERELVQKFLIMDSDEPETPVIGHHSTLQDDKLEEGAKNVEKLIQNYEERIKAQKEAIANIVVTPLPKSPEPYLSEQVQIDNNSKITSPDEDLKQTDFNELLKNYYTKEKASPPGESNSEDISSLGSLDDNYISTQDSTMEEPFEEQLVR